MNPAAILTLISSLMEQIIQLQEKVAALEAAASRPPVPGE